MACSVFNWTLPLRICIIPKWNGSDFIRVCHVIWWQEKREPLWIQRGDNLIMLPVLLKCAVLQLHVSGGIKKEKILYITQFCYMKCNWLVILCSDEVAVIDEIQMIRDPARGWAWTRALLGECSAMLKCNWSVLWWFELSKFLDCLWHQYFTILKPVCFFTKLQEEKVC